MTCEEFNEMLSGMSDDDESCELNCYEPYDCSVTSGLEMCMETYCENSCDGYTTESCIVNFEHHGEMRDADCDEFWSHVNSTNGTDDCGYQCELHYDCAEDLELAKCEVLTCIDACTLEGACFVDFADASMEVEQKMDCEMFMELYDVDLEEDDCEICHKEDCREETGLEHCEWNQCFDGCTMDDHCFVHFKVDRDSQEMQMLSCEAFEGMMAGECVDVIERGDCKMDIDMHVDNVKKCNYTVGFNTCEEEEQFCNVYVKVGDEEHYFDDCEEAEHHFDLPECEDIMAEEGSCLEDIQDYVEGAESCFYQQWMNECSGMESYCYAHVVINGEEHDGDCKDLQEHFGIPTEDDDEDNCGEIISKGSCKYDAKKYIDDLEECGF